LKYELIDWNWRTHGTQGLWIKLEMCSYSTKGRASY